MPASVVSVANDLVAAGLEVEVGVEDSSGEPAMSSRVEVDGTPARMCNVSNPPQATDELRVHSEAHSHNWCRANDEPTIDCCLSNGDEVLWRCNVTGNNHDLSRTELLALSLDLL
jgi:hypothetical protein